MRTSTLVLSALLPICTITTGCADENRARDLPPAAPASTPTSNTTVPEGNSSAGPGRATTVPPDAEKDQRGNSPPGIDRSGGGPLDGAIRDPNGAVTKQPEPKQPVQ